MASHPESRLPQPGREKRRSFLPAPSRSSNLPTVNTKSREASPSRVEKYREASPSRDDKNVIVTQSISVGDRVCIGGIKHGTLKFLGEVHLAPGIWCGIELDDPDGKHDGEVEGRRYFHCHRGHGVFAPFDKVELVEPVQVQIKPAEVSENVLKRRSLPRPVTALPKSALPSARPLSVGSLPDVRKQVETVKDEIEEDPFEAHAAKVKGSVIQQKSQIAKISGIPRVGFVSGLPSTQLKQQDSGSTPELRYGKDGPQKDIKSIFSSYQSKSVEDSGSERLGSSGDATQGIKSTSAPTDQVVVKPTKPSRLPGASRLPTKFSKLERPSPTESKPVPLEVANQQELPSKQLSKTADGMSSVNKTFDISTKENIQEVVAETQPTSGQTTAEEAADLTRQLRSDSRQFLNITFDAENNSSLSPPSLPDVVSSASMSPDSVDGSQSEVDKDSTNKANTDEASLDLFDDEAMWDNTDLLDGLDRETNMADDRMTADTSGSSVMNDTACIVASTPLPVGKRKFCPEDQDDEAVANKTNISGIKDLFPKLEEGNINTNATFNVDSSDHSADVTLEQRSSCTEGRSTGSSGMSQVGKCDLIDTVESSKSSNSARQDTGEHTFLVEKGITDISIPLTEMDQVREIEKTRVEDILEGMSKSVVMDLEKALDGNDKSMTDSGIMDPIILNRRSLTESGVTILSQQENRRSLTDSGILDLMQKDKKPMIDSGISDGSMTKSQQLDLEDSARLEADLRAGHMKKERPVSLISTTSADTGYVPDTDSEAGTLTTNSPLDWMEKHVGIGPTLSSVEEQDDSYRESFTESQDPSKVSVAVKDSECDSDNYSDIGAGRSDTDMGRKEIEMDDASLPVQDCEVSGVSLMASDSSSLQGSTAQAVSPSSLDSSLMEDDRAEADQIHSVKGGNLDSSPENTLKDLSDTSPDAGVMPIEESVILGEITASSQGEISLKESVETANESASQDVLAGSADASVNIDDSIQECSGEDKSAIDLDKSGQEEASALKTPSKGKSATPASKKKSAEKVIEHKKPNLKVRSSLADYIRAPVPTKPKEEKVDEAKLKKNVMNKKRADNKKTDVGKSPESAIVKTDENTTESKRIRPKIEKEPPKPIKRTPPKSKWDNIMSQLDSSKVPKPKPKSEIKSKLEMYLATPVPVAPKKEKEAKKETKPRTKLVSSPKPDYSKVKSKLSISTPPPLKREQSPVTNKSQRMKSPRPLPRLSNGNIHLDLSESFDNSVHSSARSSRTDLSVDIIENVPESPRESKARTPRNSTNRVSSIKTDRPPSVASTLSDTSQGSVKHKNAKNKKNDLPKPETPRIKKYSNVKSSIPPPAPRKPAPSKTPQKKSPETSHKDVSKTSPKKSPNQNRNRTIRTPSKTSNHLKGSHQPDIVSNSLRSSSEKEIGRLETLCESRTKELNIIKMQLKNSTQAFDAMSCLVKYLTQELDAFSCPFLAEELGKAKEQLKEAEGHIAELDNHKSRLEEEISALTKSQGESTEEVNRLQKDITSLNEAHEKAIAQLKEEHETTVNDMKEAARKAETEYKAKAMDHHEHVISYMKDCHDRNVSDINLDHQRAIDSLRLSHLEDIEKLRTKHDNQMEELHKQHRDKLEDITHRFETIKMTLGDKVETLRGECEDLRLRAKISEEALLRDSDVKLQLALQPFRNLPAEIESLKLVIEMRNQEVQKLRKQNMELEKQLEELPIAKEKIDSLQKKSENLEAIINIKTDHEKQLHEKCQNLMRRCDKESKANKRLSMDYEQLMWKVDQQDFGSTESLYRRQLSRSPPRSECSSPDLIRKGLSPITSENDSPCRRSHKSASSTGDDSFERKLKRRSATFLLEKEKSSPSASPQAKRLSPSSFENSPPRVMTQSAPDELSYTVSPATSSPPDSSSYSVSQSMSHSMTQSMTQSMTDSDIFGDFESSGIVTNGHEISVSVMLPEVESEVFTVIEEKEKKVTKDEVETNV
ncbi:microtubule-associated tumor suppressor candidate 2 homolog isoform X3 [Haliotis asinina]|uniref:microtubule-associated tumor suppressor candidate 2 homolog isoform X2 n=1 Tax=Haliotis asinina TaxID=109174 RepID=UPI003532319E